MGKPSWGCGVCLVSFASTFSLINFLCISVFMFMSSGVPTADCSAAMPQKQQKNGQTSHYIELGGYQYWPVLVPRGIRLYTYEQIPVFLRENPYITDGYRAYLPSRLCIKR